MTKQTAIEEATTIAIDEKLTMVVVYVLNPDNPPELNYEYCPKAATDYLFRKAKKEVLITSYGESLYIA